MSEETINALPVQGWTSDDWEEVQQRAVNPFRANEARAVNRLTRILTKGEDAILTQRNIEFIDGTTLRIYKGSYIKDDVYVEFTEDLDLDFTDEDNYYSESYRGMTEAGTYWVALVYTFINSIPNPYATFKIIKREEDISENTLIVVKLEVKEDEENPGSFVIDEDACIGCGLCLKHCPAGAITNNATGEIKAGKKLAYKVIDPSKCIKCGACVDSCKFKAILKK